MQLIFSKDKAKIYIFFRKAINMIFYFPKKEKKGSVLNIYCPLESRGGIQKEEGMPKWTHPLLYGNIRTPLGIRTLDPLIKSQLLYQLS